MKTLEEKAKAYDEAIAKAQKELQTCSSTDCDAARQIYRFFPELQDSEDERIRKALKEGFKYHQLFNPTFGGIPCIEIINWLEKQCGQKSKWSEEDERMLHTIIADFKGFIRDNTSTLESHFNECIDWLKSLKQRMEEQ